MTDSRSHFDVVIIGGHRSFIPSKASVTRAALQSGRELSAEVRTMRHIRNAASCDKAGECAPMYGACLGAQTSERQGASPF